MTSPNSMVGVAMHGYRWRRGALPGLLLVSLFAGGCSAETRTSTPAATFSAGASPAAATTPPVATSPPADVASNAAVQAWFKRTEPKRLAVNDALLKAHHQLDGVAGAGNGCAQLRAAADDAMIATLPTPKRALDVPVVAGIALFHSGAVACIAGNTATARQLLAAGAQTRADAENILDEILESPNATVK